MLAAVVCPYCGIAFGPDQKNCIYCGATNVKQQVSSSYLPRIAPFQPSGTTEKASLVDPQTTTSEPASRPSLSSRKAKKKRAFEIEGSCCYEAIRRCLWTAVQPRAVRNVFGRKGQKGNTRLWIERDFGGPKGRIYVETDYKATLSKIDENTEVIKAGHVMGVFYSSKSGDTSIRWRAPERNEEQGRLWGKTTFRFFTQLLGYGAMVKPTEPLPTDPKTEPED